MARKKFQLYHGSVYEYLDSNSDKQLCLYMCDCNLTNSICIIPIKDPKDGDMFIEVEPLHKVAYYREYCEIDRKTITNPLYIKGKKMKVPYSIYLQLSNLIMECLLAKTACTYQTLNSNRATNLTKENYILTEDYYKYLTWFDYKTKLNFQTHLNNQPAILKGGVYYVELGQNIGSELNKLRPALIYKKNVSKDNPNNSSYIVLPLSSKAKNSRYQHNWPVSINNRVNYIRVNDMIRISIKRIKYPLLDKSTNRPIVLSADDMEEVRKKVKEYFVD